MKRYYFYKRNNNIREDLKGDLIDFSLSALYGEKAYSQKKRKEIMNFSFFDEIKICISTKTKGIYRVEYDSGTDGCSGHWATSLQELKEAFVSDEFTLISEKQYFRLRKIALHLIFKNINFFHPVDDDAERHFFSENKTRRGKRGFYEIKLVSTSQKYNIRNCEQSTLDYYSDNNLKLRDLRIDEAIKIFISKDSNYKSSKFEIESCHFNSYFEDMQELRKWSLVLKSQETKEITEYQFERFKKICKALILDRSSLDISKILLKQHHLITILDI